MSAYLLYSPGKPLTLLNSQYLETLCDILYDDLRPRILHEPRLTVLCDVCTVLQALMVLDAVSSPTVSTTSSTIASSDDEDDDGSNSYLEAAGGDTVAKNRRTRSFGEHTVSHGPTAQSSFGRGKLHTGQLLKMVLQDAQTRLFFKAQAVVQSEIRHYVPTPDDLRWPDILLCSYILFDWPLREFFSIHLGSLQLQRRHLQVPFFKKRNPRPEYFTMCLACNSKTYGILLYGALFGSSPSFVTS